MVGGIQRFPVDDRILTQDFHPLRNPDVVNGKFLRFVRRLARAGPIRIDHRIVVVGTVSGMIIGAAIGGLPAVFLQIFPGAGSVPAIQIPHKDDRTLIRRCDLLHGVGHFHGVVAADDFIFEFQLPPEMGVEYGKNLPGFLFFQDRTSPAFGNIQFFMEEIPTGFQQLKAGCPVKQRRVIDSAVGFRGDRSVIPLQILERFARPPVCRGLLKTENVGIVPVEDDFQQRCPGRNGIAEIVAPDIAGHDADRLCSHIYDSSFIDG